MFLRDFIPQINRIFLLPGERKRKKALRKVSFKKFDFEGFFFNAAAYLICLAFL